jgi:hypothetical protein
LLSLSAFSSSSFLFFSIISSPSLTVPIRAITTIYYWLFSFFVAARILFPGSKNIHSNFNTLYLWVAFSSFCFYRLNQLCPGSLYLISHLQKISPCSLQIKKNNWNNWIQSKLIYKTCNLDHNIKII